MKIGAKYVLFIKMVKLVQFENEHCGIFAVCKWILWNIWSWPINIVEYLKFINHNFDKMISLQNNLVLRNKRARNCIKAFENSCQSIPDGSVSSAVNFEREDLPERPLGGNSPPAPVPDPFSSAALPSFCSAIGAVAASRFKKNLVAIAPALRIVTNRFNVSPITVVPKSIDTSADS